jgi:hypothetical protein
MKKSWMLSRPSPHARISESCWLVNLYAAISFNCVSSFFWLLVVVFSICIVTLNYNTF